MPYDFVVLNPSESARIGDVALDLGEVEALIEEGVRLGLPILGSLPEYWGGDERHLSLDEVRSLSDELARVVESAPRESQLAIALSKLQRIVGVALGMGRPIEIVPE